MRRIVLVFCVMVLPGLVSAQNTIPDQRRVAVFVELGDNADFRDADLALLQSSFIVTLSDESETILVLNAGRFPEPFDQRERSNLTISREADAWVAVVISGSMDALELEVTAYDLVTRKTVYSATVQRDVPTRYRDLDRRLWSETIFELGDSFETIDFGVIVTLEGEPGTVVTGALETPVTLGARGLASVRLPNPSAFQIRATAPGFIPIRREFTLEDEPITVPLLQERSPLFLLDLYAHTLNFPGVSFGWFVLPDFLLLRTGFTTFLAGVYLLESEDVPLPFFLSFPFSQIDLGLLVFLNPGDDLIRAYAGVSVSTRLIHSQNYVGLDPLSPVAGAITAGVQAQILDWFVAFLEYSPTAYFTSDSELMASSHAGNYEPFYTVALDGFYIDLLTFRAGVRLKL